MPGPEETRHRSTAPASQASPATVYRTRATRVLRADFRSRPSLAAAPESSGNALDGHIDTDRSPAIQGDREGDRAPAPVAAGEVGVHQGAVSPDLRRADHASGVLGDEADGVWSSNPGGGGEAKIC